MNIYDVKDFQSILRYMSEKANWNINFDFVEDIEDITYGFDAEDIGLKDEEFYKIKKMSMLRPLEDNQPWGIFGIEFESNHFEKSALKKILSGLVPRRKNKDHVVWNKKNLIFFCFWGIGMERTVGIVHFEENETGFQYIKINYCSLMIETKRNVTLFADRLVKLQGLYDGSCDWMEAFGNTYKKVINDTKTLTVELAEQAKNIKNRIMDTLKVESKNGYVHLLYEKFKNTLIHDMTETQFADMYAQTVVYGLFSARCMDKTENDFSADEAVSNIPNTNPFLKNLMRECIGAENNSKLSFDELEIGNVVDLLLHTQISSIIKDFNRQTGGGKEDPVIHFYEEFLTQYDKTQKVEGGVFYTPQPVVDFMVNAVDTFLKKEFGIVDGLMSTDTKNITIKRESLRRISNGYKTDIESSIVVPAIQILDPATGTGTFPQQIIYKIYDEFVDSNKEKSETQIKELWNKYVPEHLLPRLNGFEIKMAPYSVAHMKLAMVLAETGYKFESNQRLGVYLTNTLEEPGNSSKQMSFLVDSLASEATDANEVKKNKGINVVIGNPPYNEESINKNNWIMELMNIYKHEPNSNLKLQEKNSKSLNDDYIKFIRYAQHIMENNQGIIAYINPHGFTDGTIFRGMRWELMQEFSDIYILDLHGNANRFEKSPDGSKDENVFDIKQGVSINFFIKKNKKKNDKCNVYRADLYGLRVEKNKILKNSSIYEIQWEKVKPIEPACLFLNQNIGKKQKYEEGFSVDELFGVYGTGILTKRDNLCIHETKQGVQTAVNDILNLSRRDMYLKYNLPEDVRDWKYEWAKEDILLTGFDSSRIKEIAYRPFDNRYIYYTGQARGFVGWPVHAIMQHMINTDNIALITAKSNKSDTCSQFFVSKNLVEYKCGERTTNSSVFPLYLKEDLALQKSINYNLNIVYKIENCINMRYSEGKTSTNDVFNEKDLFYYIYAVLYSEIYRNEFKEFINRNFPRIPFPKSKEFFMILKQFGERLVNLHIMNEGIIIDTDAEFKGEGNYIIEKYNWNNNSVIINNTQSFKGISLDEWNFFIAGYQPLQKWLKDRKLNQLNADSIKHYIQMIGVIRESIHTMKLIDNKMKEVI